MTLTGSLQECVFRAEQKGVIRGERPYGTEADSALSPIGEVGR